MVLRGYWNGYARCKLGYWVWYVSGYVGCKLGYGVKVGMKDAGVAGSCRIAFLPLDLRLFHLLLFIIRKLMNC